MLSVREAVLLVVVASNLLPFIFQWMILWSNKFHWRDVWGDKRAAVWGEKHCNSASTAVCRIHTHGAGPLQQKRQDC